MNLEVWSEYHRSIINEETVLAIPIVLDDIEQIGFLKPITYSTLDDVVTLTAITEWRKTYSKYFFTQFEPTVERTRNWLSVLLGDDRRMMFMIHSGDDVIGHYGFRDLTEKSVLLDNLLRGRSGGHPVLMRATVASLSKWLFKTTHVDFVYGYILSDNPYAIKLHRDLGFIFDQRLPIHEKLPGSEKEWVVGKLGDTSPINKYYQKIILYSSK